MNTTIINNAKIFKALGDENRLMILELLRSGEQCACILLEKLKITQPTLSHHMKILVDSGIISARREGKWMFYSISTKGIAHAKDILISLATVIENCECVKI